MMNRADQCQHAPLWPAVTAHGLMKSLAQPHQKSNYSTRLSRLIGRYTLASTQHSSHCHIQPLSFEIDSLNELFMK